MKLQLKLIEHHKKATKNSFDIRSLKVANGLILAHFNLSIYWHSKMEQSFLKNTKATRLC